MILQILKSLLKIKRFAIGITILVLIVLLAIIGPSLYDVDPFDFGNPRDMPPSWQHPLGTDSFGRNLLAQLMHAIRTSLYIGLIAATIAVVIGVILGGISGYKRGMVDESLMSVTNIGLLTPSILLMVMIAAYLRVRSPLMVAVIIGATSWPGIARGIRAQTLSLAEREHVHLSIMSAYRASRVLFEDILPNMAAYIFTLFIIYMSGAMLAETGLSLLGAGPTTGTSLGRILFWAQNMYAVSRGLWLWFVPPGAILVALASSLFIIASALDEYFNPRLRSR